MKTFQILQFAYISTPKMIKQYTLGGKWNGNFSDYFSNNSRVIFTGSFIKSLELGYERGVLKSKTLSFSRLNLSIKWRARVEKTVGL